MGCISFSGGRVDHAPGGQASSMSELEEAQQSCGPDLLILCTEEETIPEIYQP